MGSLTEKIKEQVRAEFSEYLDKLFDTWDGESPMESRIKVSVIPPHILIPINDVKPISFERKGREDS